jgi:hypothetical protein
VPDAAPTARRSLVTRDSDNATRPARRAAGTMNSRTAREDDPSGIPIIRAATGPRSRDQRQWTLLGALGLLDGLAYTARTYAFRSKETS